MSHDAAPPLLKHSVFLSYASADRAAARALRDTLAAAGLEVWLDEEELAGGEAWDAKIRNQIRTCTYFMPLISATTEQRREGYFRREWRLAVERTLDQADDVMFLVPVVIDGTRDHGARVPEKFLSVQWLRAPGGAATTELQQLASRLAAGDTPGHFAAVPLELAEVVVESKASRKRRAAGAPPPPFPKFPAYPEPGHHFRFLYDIVLWAGHMIHALWMRLPRGVRYIASIVIVFNVISSTFRGCQLDRTTPDKPAQVAELVRGATAKDHVPTAESIKSLMGLATHALQAGRPLAVVTFAGNDVATSAYAGSIFTDTLKQLHEAGDSFGLSPIPLDEDDDEDDAFARGTKLESQFVLTGLAHRAAAGQPVLFTAKLYEMKTRTVLWTETYDAARVDASAAARQVVAAVRARTALPPTPPATP